MTKLRRLWGSQPMLFVHAAIITAGALYFGGELVALFVTFATGVGIGAVLESERGQSEVRR